MQRVIYLNIYCHCSVIAISSVRACVEPYPYPEAGVWFVLDPEGGDGLEDGDVLYCAVLCCTVLYCAVLCLEDAEGHARDLPGVVVAVPDWEARHHHVGVPDSLHLGQGG